MSDKKIEYSTSCMTIFEGDKLEYVIEDLSDKQSDWTKLPNQLGQPGLSNQPNLKGEPFPMSDAPHQSVYPENFRVFNGLNTATPPPNNLSDRSPVRIKQAVLGLVQRHNVITRKELMNELNLSSGTATKYLRQLTNEGLIEKIMPSRSPRSHYFQLRQEN